MNKYILLVMKWLNDNDSVSQDELVNNYRYAWAYADYASDAASAAAHTDSAAAGAGAAYDDDDVDAARWVDMYFERTNENKEDYVDEVNK